MVLTVFLGRDILLSGFSDRLVLSRYLIYGLVLGTAIGYQFSPWQSDWETSGIDIFDDPGIKYQGPRINFSLGFGWGVD